MAVVVHQKAEETDRKSERSPMRPRRCMQNAPHDYAIQTSQCTNTVMGGNITWDICWVPYAKQCCCFFKGDLPILQHQGNQDPSGLSSLVPPPFALPRREHKELIFQNNAGQPLCPYWPHPSTSQHSGLLKASQQQHQNLSTQRSASVGRLGCSRLIHITM